MPPATVYQTREPRSAAVPRQSLRARSKCDSAPGPPGAAPAGGAPCAGATPTSNAADIPVTITNAGKRMRRIRPPGDDRRQRLPVSLWKTAWPVDSGLHHRDRTATLHRVVVPVRQDVHMSLHTIDALVGAALALGADQVRGWSEAERALAADAPRVEESTVRGLREEIRAGHDPMGEAFAGIRAAERRRALGQTYTPAPIVASMVGWAAAR